MHRSPLEHTQTREQIEQSALVAVVNAGNLRQKDRIEVRRAIEAAGGDISFAKNTLTAKGLKAAIRKGLLGLGISSPSDAEVRTSHQ